MQVRSRVLASAVGAAALLAPIALATSAQAATSWGTRGDVPVPADYNGDHRADLAVFRPTNGTWYVRGRSSVQFGASGDVPHPFVQDNTLSVFRPSTGTWYTRGVEPIRYGTDGDVPVGGNYSGALSGAEEPAVFRPSNGTWYIDGGGSVQFGANGDVAVPRNYGGSIATDIAVWRPSSGIWYVRGVGTTQYGANGDIPVPADYSGDGRADLAVFRPSSGTWYLKGQASTQFGTNGDIPVPADYNGDGRADLAVFRPSSGTWYIKAAPTPPPAGPLACRASANPANPQQYHDVTIDVATKAGARATATFHYKTTTPSQSATAGSNGHAYITRNISGATVGYRVTVNVTVTLSGHSATCSTSFVPRS